MRPRPLSPHLQVYRWQITMVLSILHRLTGAFLALGMAGMSFWLLALAQGEATHHQWFGWLHSLPGRFVLWLFVLALVYHLCNGLRHLYWDLGRGLSNEGVTRSGRLVVACTLVLTGLLWWLAGGGS